jgi:hypothetical protein
VSNVSHHHHHTALAFTIGKELPITAVICDPEGDPVGMTYFTVLFSDAPHKADELTEDDERRAIVCMHCLIDDHPELGRGLDLAKHHGGAFSYDATADEWFEDPSVL